MLLSLVGNLLGRSFQPLFPAFVHDALNGDARDLSFLMTAAGIGGLTGACGTASLGTLRHGGIVFACSGIAPGSMLVLFGVRSLAPAIALAYLVAACSQLFITMAACSQLFVTMAAARYNRDTPTGCGYGSWDSRRSSSRAGFSMDAMPVGSLGAAIGIGALPFAPGGSGWLRSRPGALDRRRRVRRATSARLLARVASLRGDGTWPEPAAARFTSPARSLPGS